MDIREYPCCMCPAIPYDFQKDVCDGKGIFLDKKVEPCNFVNRYKDERGWIFFVRKGIGEGEIYKSFYKKPQQTCERGYRNLPWRKSFREAQEDLNKLAQKKGWVVA